MTAKIARDAEHGQRSGASVVLKGVSKTYRTKAGVTVAALRDVSLDIVPGSTMALIAPSGAGKSTLLHVLGAMDAPDQGTVSVDRQDVTAARPKDLAEYRRRVGFVFQRFHLLPGLTALDNVLAPLLPYRPGKEAMGRARDLLDAVGMGDRKDALPSSLSGGQQQRVAIARALISQPRMLLADEPTGNLDSATGASVLELLLAQQKRIGFTAVIATHDVAIAAACERRVHLLDGRVVRDDSASEQGASQD